MPTERGYRFYVDRLLERLEPRPARFPLDLTAARSEVEAALQATTEMLSQVTRLLALVSAPPLETATVRHVEVLLLQPQVVMVVVITSTGGVTKRVFAFDAPVDPGLANWAGQYLNEQLVGLPLGSAQLRRRLDDPGLPPRERAFLDVLAPAFTEAEDDEQRLFVGGAAGLLDEVRGRGARRVPRAARPARAARARCSTCSPRRSTRAGRSSASATSSPSRRSATSRSSAPRTGSRTGRSARSACSARCAWTTTRRSAPSARPRPSSRASPRSIYGED